MSFKRYELILIGLAVVVSITSLATSSGQNIIYHKTISDNIDYVSWVSDLLFNGNYLYGVGKLCFFDGTCLNSTAAINDTFVPYNGAFNNVNLGNNNLTLNRTLVFGEGSGVKPLLTMGNAGGDNFVMEYNYDFENINDDTLVFRKTDGNDANPDGQIAFVMTNMSGYNKTILKLDGYGNANFTNQNISTTGNYIGNVFYGGMYNFSDAGYNINIPTSGVYYNVTGLECGEINGFNCSSSTGVMTANHDGVYKIDFSIALKVSAGGNGLYGIGIAKNYSDLEVQKRCYGRIWATSGQVSGTSGTCFLRLNVGDMLNFMIDDEVNPARTVAWETIQFTAIRVGN